MTDGSKPPNISLIGMPASGKSTVGRLLAKKIHYAFVDVDDLLSEEIGMSPGEYLQRFGASELLQREEDVILGLRRHNTVFAPGGSCVYSSKAMKRLGEITTIVYLNVPLDIVIQRIGSPTARGVIGSTTRSLRELYEERTPLYETYADLTIDTDDKDEGKTPEDLVKEIAAILS